MSYTLTEVQAQPDSVECCGNNEVRRDRRLPSWCGRSRSALVGSACHPSGWASGPLTCSGPSSWHANQVQDPGPPALRWLTVVPPQQARLSPGRESVLSIPVGGWSWCCSVTEGCPVGEQPHARSCWGAVGRPRQSALSLLSPFDSGGGHGLCLRASRSRTQGS